MGDAMDNKTKEYLYKDNIDMIKNYIDIGTGYSFDNTKKREIKNDYSRVYRFINKEFERNNKIR